MKNVNFKFKIHIKQALVSASVYELSHESSLHLNTANIAKNTSRLFSVESRVCALGCKYVIAIDETQPVTSLSGIVQKYKNCSAIFNFKLY